ncbi:unnamed protein product [Spirodela intermedia]|uniref:Uncharacterized protein n=1 Tax=Spirodela intermedia TaxID=51605 RepID=A0A7I8JEZ9_SPIIN|nr:unnamed protein product [Spirodela intermedia]CAA6668717.1 unnamed protein product [Spirodela intermedia]
MAGFGSLLRPFRRESARSRLHFHAGATLLRLPPPLLSLFTPPPSVPPVAVFPDPSAALLRFTSCGSRLFSPLWRRVPFSGPLFLSSPPWKLSQAATPLYLQGEETGLRLARKPGFRLRLGFRSSGKVRAGLADAVRWVRPPGGDNVVAAARLASDERVLNLPNVIFHQSNGLRPRDRWMILSEWYIPAFVGLGISGLTDWELKINSVLGSYLDPLADKVLIGCVALAMVKKDLLHAGLVELIVFRDIGLIGGAVYKRASSMGWEWKNLSDFVHLDKIRQEKVEPLFISKVNTVFQLALVAAALLQPEFGSEQTQLYITYLSWLVASTTVASSVAYGAQLLRPR